MDESYKHNVEQKKPETKRTHPECLHLHKAQKQANEFMLLKVRKVNTLGRIDGKEAQGGGGEL